VGTAPRRASIAPVSVHRVDRLWPDPASDLRLEDALADLDLPDAPAGRPYVAINMVTSVDGRAQVAGAAEGLGSAVDRRVMRLLRAGFDAVGSGSGTVRAAGFWPGLPDDLRRRRIVDGRTAQPASVVIAGSTPVVLEQWHDAGEQRILVVGRDNLQGADGVEVLRAPTTEPEPRWILPRLRERGIATFLLEGGPTVNAAFLAAGALDEVFWTIGASLVASDALGMIAPIDGGSPWADAPRRGSLVSVHRNGDELFMRYRFDASGSIGS
jgi:2,5-diamino-6-(ribosylamino)-4(3H)-pyrimidinone 5'-phosphate reductase